MPCKLIHSWMDVSSTCYQTIILSNHPKLIWSSFDCSKCTKRLPFHSCKTVLPALVPHPSDIFRKRRNLVERFVFLCFVVFLTVFFCSASLTYIHFSERHSFMLSSLPLLICYSFCSLTLSLIPILHFDLPARIAQIWIHVNTGSDVKFILTKRNLFQL